MDKKNKCIVSPTSVTKKLFYFGVVENNWKQTFYSHKKSFKYERYRNDTTSAWT